MSRIVVNLGGEGEVPGALDVQGDWVNDPNWRSSAASKTLAELQAAGHRFLIITDFRYLPFTDDSVDQVITNSVPVDQSTFLGTGIQSSEIARILVPGGTWIDNGAVRLIK